MNVIDRPRNLDEEKIKTANPDATPEARRLLGFLYEIQGRYILGGQHNFIATCECRGTGITKWLGMVYAVGKFCLVG